MAYLNCICNDVRPWKGRTAVEEFCGLLNMNAPVKQKSWDIHFPSVLHATESVTNESMKAAAKEIQKEDRVTDTAVTCDGTWQKRGHLSLHGVVTVLSSESGKNSTMNHSVDIATRVLIRQTSQLGRRRHMKRFALETITVLPRQWNP